MKKKPDAIVTVVALFFIGLAVNGFSSITFGSDDDIAPVSELGAQVAYDRSVSRY